MLAAKDTSGTKPFNEIMTTSDRIIEEYIGRGVMRVEEPRRDRSKASTFCTRPRVRTYKKC